MSDSSLFKWRHFQADMILCAVRWYLRDALSCRDVEELMRERGVWVDHTTVFRWVQRDAPELDQRCRPQLKATNDSYRLDETYIKIKKRWYYLYRAVDSTGATLDFRLSAIRDAGAAERFFRQVLQASQTLTPRVMTADQNAAYPPAFESLQQESMLPENCVLRTCKYLNNVVKPDHRLVKRRVNPGLGCGAFATAQRTIQGYDAMHMLPALVPTSFTPVRTEADRIPWRKPALQEHLTVHARSARWQGAHAWRLTQDEPKSVTSRMRAPCSSAYTCRETRD